jgi:hypothetical protein
MSHSHRRKASALATSFVITTLSISGCDKAPEVTVNPPPPKTEDCHPHGGNKDEHCHKNEKPKSPEPEKPIIIANPPMPTPK